MDGETIDAINAALIATYAGIEPVLNAEGQWTWSFAEEEGERQRVFTGKPPPWVQDDLQQLQFIIDQLMVAQGFVWSYFGKPVNGADGLKTGMYQVTIGKLEGNSVKPVHRVEAAPLGLAIGMLLLVHARVDVNAWRDRLFPKVALAGVNEARLN